MICTGWAWNGISEAAPAEKMHPIIKAAVLTSMPPILHSCKKLGLTYPCFCNRAELHAAQAPHLSDGRILYAGTCRHLTAEQTAAKARTKDPAQRLRLPDTAVSFIDGHYGPYTQNLAAECGDIILRRSDGVYAYQLAVVVDDALMGITEIVRGCDLLSSTPQQLYLYQLLGFTPPAFIHVPLLMAADGRRLSKRNRDLDLGFLRQHFCQSSAAHRPPCLPGRTAAGT